MKKLALLVLLPLAAQLGGCIKFSAEPPASLLTLTAETPVAVGQSSSSATARSITITVPAVPQELAVARVLVRSSETSVAYLKDAQWVEPPNRLFARLLSDVITARTGRIVLSLRQSFSDPGGRLSGELRYFGIDTAANEVIVTFDGTLTRDRPASAAGAHTPTTFEKRRFEARVPLAEVTPTATGTALNTAANQVAIQVADWIGR